MINNLSIAIDKVFFDDDLYRMTIMQEKKHPKFIYHLTRNLFMAFIFILLALFAGMLGYHSFEKMSWIDAFANASMILSGMGPLTPLVTDGGKLFAGFYALFSGLAFIAIIGLILAPIAQRFFKKIHLEWKDLQK